MAKVSYANMKLKVDKSISTFDFEGNKHYHYFCTKLK